MPMLAFAKDSSRKEYDRQFLLPVRSLRPEGGGELFKPWPRFSTSTRRFLLIAKSEAKESGEHVRNDGPSDASAEN